MTVKELIEVLEGENPDRLVVMSKDSEGNGFSPLADASTESYQASCTWAGEIGIEKLTPELEKDGYTEEDVMDGVPALVLWPTN
jgi:hypothetical protein